MAFIIRTKQTSDINPPSFQVYVNIFWSFNAIFTKRGIIAVLIN